MVKQELNLVMEGQSNAGNIVGLFGLMPVLRADIAADLGYPVGDIAVIDAATTMPGTPMIPDPAAPESDPWLQFANGAGWTGGWVNGLESYVLAYYKSLPSDVLAAPTIIDVLHNETDSTDPILTTAEQFSALQFEAAEIRGIFTGEVRFEYVNGLPYLGGSDASMQAIKLAFQALADTPAFDAGLAAQTADVDMDLTTDGGFDGFGGPHMDYRDALQLVARMAASDAMGFAAYAQPGSPVATGQVDSTGAQAVSARLIGAHQLLVTLDVPASSGLLLWLDSQAGSGLGWMATDGSAATRPAQVSAIPGALVLTFSGPIPVGGTLYYNYGNSRLAAPADAASPNGYAGRGNGIYDTNGMPLSVPAGGIVIGAPVALHQQAAIGEDTISVAGSAYVVGAARLTVVNGGGDTTVVGAPNGGTTVAGGAGRVIVVGGGGGLLAFGGSAGNNLISTGGGDCSVVGGGDGDQLYVTGTGRDAVWAGSGNETVSAQTATGAGNYLLGGTGSDVIIAGDGSTVFGGAGGGVIETGSGNSLVIENGANEFTFLDRGNSTLFGGAGQDIYAAVRGISGGLDVIVGFKAGVDKLSLQGYGADANSTALASSVAGNGFVYLPLLDGAQIVLYGINHLTAADFV